MNRAKEGYDKGEPAFIVSGHRAMNVTMTTMTSTIVTMEGESRVVWSAFLGDVGVSFVVAHL